MSDKVFIELYQGAECAIYMNREDLVEELLEGDPEFEREVAMYFHDYVVETPLFNHEHLGDDVDKFVALKTVYDENGGVKGSDAILFALTKDSLISLFSEFPDEFREANRKKCMDVVNTPNIGAFEMMYELDEMMVHWNDGIIDDEADPYRIDLYEVLEVNGL